MKILVYGAGAIGSLFGGLLSAAHDVTLVGRARRMDAIRRSGLTVRIGEEEETFRPRAETEIPPGTSWDLVALAVKTFDLDAARHDLARVDPPPPSLLLLQNGIGNEEALRGAIAPERIVRGIVYHGVSAPEPGRVEWFGRGVTLLGRPLAPDHDRRALEEMAAFFDACRFPTRVAEDVEREIWRKLAVNAAINPLGAITGLSNGALLRSPFLRDLLVAADREVEAVARAATGRPLVVAGKAEEIARLTADNRNSMLHDLEAGRRTEIDFLSGAVLRHAERHGVPAPVNRVLASLVKGKEEALRRNDASAGNPD